MIVAAGAARDPEHQALAALERGDREEALTILMEAFGAPLYRYCRQMVGDPDLANDVHQTTFLQAYEALSRSRPRGSPRSWLFGIARHRCLDALKASRRRRRRFEVVDDPPDLADSGINAEERLVVTAFSRVLERCLGNLVPRARAAVLLRYQSGVSYPEMAAICHERPATLQARVARALPVLRRCLEGQGFSL